MIPSRNKINRRIITVFITLFCVMQIAIPIHWAKADLPVIDAGNIVQTTISAVQNTVTAGATTEIAAQTTISAAADTVTAAQSTITAVRTVEDYLSKYVLMPLLRVALITLIKTTSEEVVGWIKGDGGRGVGFVKNLEQNVYTEANLQAGEFLNHVSGINLCSVNISKIIKLQIKTPGYQHLNAQLACSLTGIIDNVDRFYQSFQNGGWPAFVGVAVDSRNNAIGASLIAEVNFQAKKGSAAQALQDRLNRGSGFKGVTLKKKSLVCDNAGGEEESGHCYYEDVDTTPGGVVADALNESLNHVGVELGAATISAMTTEVDAAVSAIIMALMQRIFKEATNLF